MTPLVLLGGTFDPVHYGHLRIAAGLRTALNVPEVLLVPAAEPPHRPPPVATATDRMAMLALAIAEFDGLGIDTREIDRGGKSYTVDTLLELRREWPSRPLAWVVGADAFLGFDTWHRHRELLELAHLVVVARPGLEIAAHLRGEMAQLWDTRATADPGVIAGAAAGAIVPVETSPNAISATAIRAALAKPPIDAAALSRLLPAAVLTYIERHHLYGAVADAC